MRCTLGKNVNIAELHRLASLLNDAAKRAALAEAALSQMKPFARRVWP